MVTRKTHILVYAGSIPVPANRVAVDALNRLLTDDLKDALSTRPDFRWFHRLGDYE